jgi:hypothetical protein
VSAVDFSEWAAPDLTFKNLGGHTFTVRPPSVDDAVRVLALAVRGEINLGIVPKDTVIPPEIKAVLDEIQPGDHPALGDTFDEMKAKGLNATTIDRAAYYAVFYWARGKKYADALATLMWSPRASDEESTAEAGGAPRKG